MRLRERERTSLQNCEEKRRKIKWKGGEEAMNHEIKESTTKCAAIQSSWPWRHWDERLENERENRQEGLIFIWGRNHFRRDRRRDRNRKEANHHWWVWGWCFPCFARSELQVRQKHQLQETRSWECLQWTWQEWEEKADEAEMSETEMMMNWESKRESHSLPN